MSNTDVQYAKPKPHNLCVNKLCTRASSYYDQSTNVDVTDYRRAGQNSIFLTLRPRKCSKKRFRFAANIEDHTMILAPGGPRMAGDDRHGQASNDRENTRNEDAAARYESNSGISRDLGDNGAEINTKAVRRSNQVWSDERIDSPGTLAVLLVLAIMMKDTDEVALPQQRLADLARMTRASLNTHLTTAESLGYFVREPGQGRSPTLYRAAGVWME